MTSHKDFTVNRVFDINMVSLDFSWLVLHPVCAFGADAVKHCDGPGALAATCNPLTLSIFSNIVVLCYLFLHFHVSFFSFLVFSLLIDNIFSFLLFLSAGLKVKPHFSCLDVYPGNFIIN